MKTCQYFSGWKRRWYVLSTDGLRFYKVRKKRGRKGMGDRGKEKRMWDLEGGGRRGGEVEGRRLFVIFRQFI